MKYTLGIIERQHSQSYCMREGHGYVVCVDIESSYNFSSHEHKKKTQIFKQLIWENIFQINIMLKDDETEA